MLALCSFQPGLPRLLGRAEVELLVAKRDSLLPARLTLVLDGYSSPFTAGNFLDLVQRGELRQ